MAPSLELLVEFVLPHRDQISKDLVLKIDQSPLGCCMLDVKPVTVPVLRQTSIAQQCSNQYLCCLKDSTLALLELPSALSCLITPL
jgi:hypothetical protein